MKRERDVKLGSPCIFQLYVAVTGASQFEDGKLPRWEKRDFRVKREISQKSEVREERDTPMYSAVRVN